MTDRNPNSSSPEETQPFQPWPEQDENGVDLSIIRANLRLTPLQRYEKCYNAMRAMIDMREIVNSSRPVRRAEDEAA